MSMSAASAAASSPSSVVSAPALDPTRTNPLDASGVLLDRECEADDILHRQYTVGETVYDTERWVEYLPGNLPLVITVPHGGYLAPGHLADRAGGVHEPDIATQELARLLRAAFATVLQLPADTLALPHMVLARLRRGKLDMNRNEQDASGGNEETRHAWRQFHAFVRRAKREIVRGRSVTCSRDRSGVASSSSLDPVASSSSHLPGAVWSRGLYLDLHGQSHDRRHQLGYILSQQELSLLSDDTLDESAEMIDKCSLRCAVDPPTSPAATKPPSAAAVDASSSSAAASLPPFGSLSPSRSTSLSSIVRGPLSFGCLLERLGHACVPSPTSRHAGEVMYFNGGYNTYRHGSSVLGAIQRKKEREAAAAAAAAAAKATKQRSDSTAAQQAAPSHQQLGVVDPSPSFTRLFDDVLEARCFVGIQLESAYEGHRDTDANRRRFALDLARALCRFVEQHVLREGEKLPGHGLRDEDTHGKEGAAVEQRA